MNINKHKIFGQLLLLLLSTGIFVLLISAMHKKGNTICTGIEVVIADDTQPGFIDSKEVEQVIIEILNEPIRGTAIHKFRLRTIENTLEKNVWISGAELYFDINNTLHATIFQRYPIARIIDNSGASYYIDSSYFKLPLSHSERADVPVFTGVSPMLNAANNKQLVENIIAFSKQIGKDSFWLVQASQIDIQDNHFQLYPSVGNYVVDFGDGNSAADKLERLKLFYKNIAVKTGFDAWQNLSLVYNKQIVVTRKDSSASEIDEKKAVQVFDLIVKANKRQVEAEADDGIAEKNSLSIQPVPLAQLAINTLDTATTTNKNKAPPSKPNTEKDIPKAVMPKFKNN